MTLGLTFAMRQEKQDNGLSYIGFMDTLMDVSLETATNMGASLQERFTGWQARYSQVGDGGARN